MHERSEPWTTSATGPRDEQIRQGWSDLDARIRRSVQQQPLASLLVALVGGYLLARVASETA
jgi:hypothetical protein